MKVFISFCLVFFSLFFIKISTAQNPVQNPTATPSSTNNLKPYKLASIQELMEELCNVPLDNSQREDFMAKLFIQAGAKETQIQRQAIDISENPIHNIYLVKPGQTKNVIVIGAHLDHVAIGQGVIDDWSGICAVTNIYQAIKDIPTQHTIVFIGFTSEEQGLLGSKAYVRSLSEKTKALHKYMINLECLGLSESLIWVNGSDKELVDIAYSVAQKESLPLENHTLQGVGADSNSFRAANIPAITIDGLPTSKFSYIHSENDKCENVNQNFYYNSYRLAVNYLLELDKITLQPKNNE